MIGNYIRFDFRRELVFRSIGVIGPDQEKMPVSNLARRLDPVVCPRKTSSRSRWGSRGGVRRVAVRFWTSGLNHCRLCSAPLSGRHPADRDVCRADRFFDWFPLRRTTSDNLPS